MGAHQQQSKTNSDEKGPTQGQDERGLLNDKSKIRLSTMKRSKRVFWGLRFGVPPSKETHTDGMSLICLETNIVLLLKVGNY